MARKFKVGDKIQVLNDRAYEETKRGLEPSVIKTVTVHELELDENKNVVGVKFESGTTTHEDGRQEPYYLTYPLTRIVKD